MEHEKIKSIPIQTLASHCYETARLNIRLKLKITYLFLFSLYLFGWAFAILFFISGGIDSVTFCFIFSCIMFILGWWVIIQCNNSCKINSGDMYFKISSDGFEYTSIDEISGKLNHKEIFWHDVIKSCDSTSGCDVTFYNSGGKYNIEYLSFYISREFGVEEKVLIPVHEINKYKDSFYLISALLYNMATRPLPKLSFSEDVFYSFNVNPVDFTYKKKSLRRILANVMMGLILLIGTIIFFIGCMACSVYFSINILYLLPVMLTGTITLLMYSITLENKIPFLKLANGEYSILEYDRDGDIDNDKLQKLDY
ncbi:hypothetical protein ACGVWS_11140 [Enterobacteriaceae bacterium LUAb1]